MFNFSTLVNLFFALSFLSLQNCSEDVPQIINTPEELDQSLKDSYTKSRFAGFSISVIKKNQVVFQESYGKANIEDDRDLTNQTAMNIASVSKLFVGVAVMKAIEQGYFTLETDINEILPFSVTHPQSPEIPIKVRHLVTHTSGILDNEQIYFNNYSILEGEDLSTQIAQRLLKELQVKSGGEVLSLANFMKGYLTPGGALYTLNNFGSSPVGERYAYSNVASALAAYLIETATGESFEDFTQKEIFLPLSMNNTAWKLGELEKNVVSRQYWNKENPLPFYTQACYPDGSLMTSIEDLSKFMIEMISGLSGRSELLLSNASYKILFEKKFHAKPAGMSEKEDNYGVFWVWSVSGRLGHTGEDLGSFSLFGFDPNTQSGSILIINTNVTEADNGTSLEWVQEIVSAYRAFEDVD